MVWYIFSLTTIHPRVLVYLIQLIEQSHLETAQLYFSFTKVHFILRTFIRRLNVAPLLSVVSPQKLVNQINCRLTRDYKFKFGLVGLLYLCSSTKTNRQVSTLKIHAKTLVKKNHMRPKVELNKWCTYSMKLL